MGLWGFSVRLRKIENQPCPQKMRARLVSYIHAPEIKLADLFGRVFVVTSQPPAYRFGKTTDGVVQAVLPRYLAWLGELSVKYATEIFLEIPHKDFSALT